MKFCRTLSGKFCLYPLAFSLAMCTGTAAQTPAFVSFDAPDAGLAYQQGTFGGVINGKGVIATTYVDASNIIHGLVRSSTGQLTEFDPPKSSETLTLGINLPGQVVGYALVHGDLSGYLRTPSGVLKPVTAPGSTATEPFSINDSSVMIGWYNTVALDGTHGFLRDASGNYTFFDEPNAGTENNQGTFAVVINNSGVVAGSYIDSTNITHGFVRDALGNFTSFDPPNAGDTYPMAMNASGEIVGTYTEQGQTHSFLRDAAGNITNIDAPGAAGTNADALNDSGVIAGWTVGKLGKSTGFWRDASGNFHIVSAPSPNSGTVVTGLNNSGIVTGYWLDTNGAAHGFLE